MNKRSDRINKLRNQILSSVPTVSTQRAWIVTRAYEKYAQYPILIKRAKTLGDILDQMTIYISEGDLLAGNQGTAVRCPPVYPENSVVWMTEEQMAEIERRKINPLKIPKGVREELTEIAALWHGNTLLEKCYAEFPDDVLKARTTLVFSVSLEKNAIGHCVLDYEKLLRVGYNGLKREAEEQLGTLDFTDPKQLEKRDFLQAAVIVCDAVMRFAKRYTAMLRELAQNETDDSRKSELLRLAEICEKVPADPAGSFYEAVQSVYMAHIVNTIETNAYSMSFGRFDQYIYPYYQKDIAEGKLTKEQAQELINCFWCKTNDLMHVDDAESIYFHGGHPFGQHLTIGGVDRGGNDAVNEISRMCLEAHETVMLYQPDFSVRFHKNTPREFKKRTAEVIRLGLGLPQIFNDEIIIEALVKDGLPLEEARNYTPTGCVENSTANSWIRAPGGWFNLPKILELTLHEGRCAMTGKQVSFKSKRVEDIVSFDELMGIYKRHMADMIRLHVIWSNLIDDVHKRVMPQTSVSILTGDCMENGKDVVEGGARYNFTSPLMVGIANITDSMMIIKKMVFEDKNISLRDIVNALDHDFDGYESLLLRIRNWPLCYGNDIDEVDDIARDITEYFCGEFAKYRNTRDGKFRVGFWSVTANFNLGLSTAATLDGRKAGEPLSDSLAPNSGRDRSGLTASLKSVAKIPQFRASNGTVLNRHLSPADLKDDDRLDKFIDLTDGYFSLGGSNIGFNIVNADTLRAAKKDPEKYADLMVKVAGYAAFFTELGDSCQDEIIARTVHHLD
ncbi:MAG: formate C-acetyltransferase/glycerol dehydratase family glycyl radical enzyme [Oscillospiraceae bacterium]